MVRNTNLNWMVQSIPYYINLVSIPDIDDISILDMPKNPIPCHTDGMGSRTKTTNFATNYAEQLKIG